MIEQYLFKLLNLILSFINCRKIGLTDAPSLNIIIYIFLITTIIYEIYPEILFVNSSIKSYIIL